MDPETHAKIMNIFGYGILLLIPFSLLVFLSRFGFVFLLIIYPLGLIAYLIFRYQKVHCTKPGCKGKVMVEKTRHSYSKVVYTYVCPDCGSSYEADAFELKSGGAHGGGGGH